MKSCPPSLMVEEVACDRASPSDAAQVQMHIEGCAACRVEFNWAETENALFQQRAQRHLSAAPEQTQPHLRLRWRSAITAAAAIALLGLGNHYRARVGAQAPEVEVAMSQALESPNPLADSEPPRCAPGLDFDGPSCGLLMISSL